MGDEYDAVIIGSGPNGLSAAICLAREGRKVLVVEKHSVPGGGVRTEEGPLPGFHHDVCSAIYPMAKCSSVFSSFGLEDFGVEWVAPDIPLAHPLDDGSAAVMHQSISKTANQFEAKDAKAYRQIFEPLLKRSESLFSDLMAPPSIPSDLLSTLKFGLTVSPPADMFANLRFSSEGAKALFGGNAAHSVLPLNRPVTTSAIGVMLMLACHRAGWPIAKGGAQTITDALVKCLINLGGEVKCNWSIKSIDELPKATHYIFDTGPGAMAEISGELLPAGFRKRLKNYRYGPGVFKIDYALSEPVPWTAEDCRRAGTVHVGGNFSEVAESEKACWKGVHHGKPFVLTAQQSLFDESRAPKGSHTFWAYCHVPSGSKVDMTEAIENQIERFAPGFRDTIQARKTRTCHDFETYNPNCVGGDVVGGVTDIAQLLTRPVMRIKPHTTPNPSIFLCSASTPPGAGVHGMGGYWAASEVLNSSR